MIAYIPLLVLIFGLFLYMLSDRPKVVEVGRILFASGSLVMLFVLSKYVIRLMAP